MHLSVAYLITNCQVQCMAIAVKKHCTIFFIVQLLSHSTSCTHHGGSTIITLASASGQCQVHSYKSILIVTIIVFADVSSILYIQTYKIFLRLQLLIYPPNAYDQLFMIGSICALITHYTTKLRAACTTIYSTKY